MADWEIAIQLPDGAVMGGKFNAQPTPAVFNTGMVLLGMEYIDPQHWRRTLQVGRKTRVRLACVYPRA